MPQSNWLLWQLADSAFPAGGFAHSLGLEAAWQQGEITAGSLPRFVEDAIAHAAQGALPFVAAAHEAPDNLRDVDTRCEVFIRNPVANRASRVQGRAWLGTVERSFPSPAVHALCESIRSRESTRH